MLDIKEFLLSVLGVLAILLGALNLRSVGNSLMFSVGVMGRHADMRRFGFNSLIYWVGSASVVVPSIFFFFELSEWLIGVGGTELRSGGYIVSTLCLLTALFNFYVHRVGPRKDSEGRLRRQIVNLSRSVNKIEADFVFGVANGVSVLISEAGLLLGGVWLLSVSGYNGVPEIIFTSAIATSAIWAIFLALMYGVNLSSVERFRKKYGARVSFGAGALGLLISWIILANGMDLI